MDNEDKKFKLTLPNPPGGNIEIETSQNILFLGANGSGKTRLGAWIEFNSPQKGKVHRISAQKSLTMPESSSPISIDLAEKGLLFGYNNVAATIDHKIGQKWHNKPSTTLLNDFNQLMILLFSDDYEKSTAYLQISQKSEERQEPPVTKLNIIKRIWEELLPHRELILGGGKIETCTKDAPSKKYNASEMSDGERVIFYLIGQCLCVPQDGIIIIDEPELHLHKSIQKKLWNIIEQERSDCLFVYFTHDIEFAVSKEITKRIWIKSYDGNVWDWEEIQNIENIPEELIIEILGSRKPVIFTEGINGSLDVALYKELFNDFLVIPRGSCSQVIQSVKAFKQSPQFHHLSIYGIVDRDRRSDAEIVNLNSNGIFVLEVAEVEHLFCTPETLKLIAKKMALDEEETLKKATNLAFSKLSEEIDNQVSLRTVNEIKFQLNLFNDKVIGISGIQAELTRLLNAINVNDLYTAYKTELDKTIVEKDYLGLLKLYNRKTLSSQLSPIFNLKNGELSEYIIRLVRTDAVCEIRTALKGYFQGFYDMLENPEAGSAIADQ